MLYQNNLHCASNQTNRYRRYHVDQDEDQLQEYNDLGRSLMDRNIAYA